jgi:two-component system, chemotaxis family, CheB/CheR fusion protein
MPSRKTKSAKIANAFPIIGIGASAGGLAAFESFFSNFPATHPDCAFVLVQHLSPEHNSLLAEIIGRYTTMPVCEVKDGIAVEPNSVYIIPPNHNMALINQSLQLFDIAEPRGQRLPINFFFNSLARDQQNRSVGIILSGTGSDGAQGIIAIKEEGGMVISQSISSAQYDGMPNSAIATGFVDHILPPEEMGNILVNYITNTLNNLVNSPEKSRANNNANSLKKIFILLRSQTNHDFSQYKPSTINRRIERRMNVHKIENIDNYIKYLQTIPEEVEALFADLLIGVTNFFRDPEAFDVMEKKVIPDLFKEKLASDTIRVWSCGCSSGEEPYSIAMLIQEYIDTLKTSFQVQIFATDIDIQAITTARAGLYPSTITADISPQRLKRFFSLQLDGKYRIQKSIRDMIIFSEQDLVRDPPFSKLDLISCRNLLIYMGSPLQKKIIPLFHYALNTSGILFLGTSEGIGEFDDLFSDIDRKSKFYRRKENIHISKRRFLNDFIPLTSHYHPQYQIPNLNTPTSPKVSLREVTEQTLLTHISPTGILVNILGDILYLYGHTGMYLELPSGEQGVNNVLQMAREGLKRELTVALHEASTSKEIVHKPILRLKTNGHYTTVSMTIRPVKSIDPTAQGISLYLIILEEKLLPQQELMNLSTDNITPFDENTNAHIRELKNELIAKDSYIKSTQEHLQTSNEELKSANEEMKSINEELQSTNEELETSKEEMQSLNEELSTINTELQIKVIDLSQSNNDMNNLLAGTGIATLFVDYQLKILRFTPSASMLINLISTDVGRPIGHIVSNLVNYHTFQADIQDVLKTLIPKELKVYTTMGEWYMMHIMPYRTLNNVIEGAVITFVDISEIIVAEEVMRHFATVVHDAYDAITVHDLEGKMLAWNPSAMELYGWSESEALNLSLSDRIPSEEKDDQIEKIIQLSRNEILEPYLTQRIAKDGSIKEVWITATALLNEDKKIYAIATTERAKNTLID